MLLLQPHQGVNDPSPELLTRVMAEIKYCQEIASLKKKLVFSVCLFALAVFLHVPTIISIRNRAQSSGMFSYLSLAFFNLRSLGSYWQDLLWSLLESFPALEIAGLLALTLFAGITLTAMVKYIKTIRGLSQVIHN
ncbi:MAG: hypothetical protein WC794_03570 [Candidatus Doudnabacteria bacterium]|jgi:hypothetical protein